MDHYIATRALRWTRRALARAWPWLGAEFRKAPLALVLAILSLSSAGYQYLEGQRQARINAAVELSRAYLNDREIAARYAMFVDKKANHKPLDSEDFLRARSYLDLLDYIAHLVNEDLIDNKYINARIKCDIHWVLTPTAAIPQEYGLERLGTNMRRYVAALKTSACPDLPPGPE